MDPSLPGNFSSLDGVAAVFSQRPVVLAGWTHYIAFDLMMSRHIILDSQACGLSHLAVVWTIPVTLMAGPSGLFAYYVTKSMLVHGGPLAEGDSRRQSSEGQPTT